MNNEKLREEIRQAVQADPVGRHAELLNRCFVALETPQHARDSAELRRPCAERDKLKQQLRAEGDRIAELNAKLAEQQSVPDVRCKCCGYLVTQSEHRGCLRCADVNVPDGYALVPVEPTDAMKLAGNEALAQHWGAGDAYRAMLAASRLTVQPMQGVVYE